MSPEPRDLSLLMPEGDTIFRAARTLHTALAGQVVTRFETQYAQLARVHHDAPITGRVVERVEARGKHLLIHFSGVGRRESGVAEASGVGTRDSAVAEGSGYARRPSATRVAGGTQRLRVDGPMVLRTHMLMSGSWHIYRTGETWQRSRASARIVVGTADFVAVAFTVPVAEFVEAGALDEHMPLARLGPDVLAQEFDAAHAIARLSMNTRPTVAEALLDQSALAGVGNVYKSELLFLAKIWPFTPPAHVGVPTWQRLVHDARALLRANVVDPRDTGVLTYRGMRRTTGRTNPAERLYVYGRQGEPCRTCGTPVLLRHHGEHNRSTYWCPHCQPQP